MNLFATPAVVYFTQKRKIMYASLNTTNLKNKQNVLLSVKKII